MSVNINYGHLPMLLHTQAFKSSSQTLNPLIEVRPGVPTVPVYNFPRTVPLKRLLQEAPNCQVIVVEDSDNKRGKSAGLTLWRNYDSVILNQYFP
jgi:hypothetical protein